MNLSNLYILGLVFGWPIYAFITIWIWRRGEGKAARWFVVGMFFMFLWNLLEVIRLHSPFYIQEYLMYAKFCFNWLTGLSWTMFSLYYSGRVSLAKKAKVILYGIYTVMIALTLTNSFHHIVFSPPHVSNEVLPHVVFEHRLAKVHDFIMFSLLFGGTLPLLEYGLKAGRINKKQFILLGISPIPSVTLGLIGRAQLYPIPGTHLNYGLVMNVIFVSVIAYVLFNQGFFSYVPFARDVILGEISKPILVTDNNRKIADYNKEMIELFPEIEEAFGNRVSDVAPELIEEGDIQKKENGEERIYSTNNFNIIVDEEVSGETIVLDDVTEIRKRTNQLEQQTEQLEQFTSVVSHDLRNPLSVAKGYAEMVRDTGEIENIGEVRQSLERANRLIEDSLQLAREGKAIEEKEKVNLHDLVEESWETSDTKEAELEIGFERDVVIMADEGRLKTLFENLFRNSVDHGPNDVKVRVRIDGNHIYVEDTGPGIPEDEREEVLDFGYTTSEEGTGIGLATVNKIAKAHGWNMYIKESTIQNGDEELNGVCFVFEDVKYEEN